MQVGEEWPSPDGDLCKKIMCTKNHQGELAKQELIETCNKNCSKVNRQYPNVSLIHE